jgi:hypothetical protein
MSRYCCRGLLLEVLEVQQFEGDSGLPPLGVQVGTVRTARWWVGGVKGPYTRASSASWCVKNLGV